jgi:hypothetical protein
MKTLFEKLKPQYKAKLESQAEFYPNSIKVIEHELKINTSFIDLKYGTVFELMNFCNLTNFNIVTIANLFDNDLE